MSTKRWLDEASDADRFERSILTSGLDADPPVNAEAEVWQRVLAAVALPFSPGPGGGASGGAAAVTKGATVTALGKGFLLGVAASVAVAGGDRLLRDPALQRAGSVAPSAGSTAPLKGASPLERPGERSVVASLSASVSPLEAPPSELTGPLRRVGLPQHVPGGPVLELPLGSLAAAPSPAQQSSVAAFPISDASAPAPRSRLDEEAALLRQARSELRARSLAAAFATLEASRARFSAPELYQEREALLIELLSRSGQRDQARERAQSFLTRFPESPHAAAVRALAGSSK